MATKIILAGDLCVIDSHDEFLLTIDGEALGKVVGKENAEKSVIVIVEQREKELKNASTRVSREKIDNGFIILTQALGYLVNGSPVQKHVVQFLSLPSLAFETKEEISEHVPVAVVKTEEIVEEVQPEVIKEIPVQKEEPEYVPYNSSASYDTYTSAY